jgi:hypothetical protein
VSDLTFDLADSVYDAMAEFAHDDASSSFTVYRSSEDGSAAVTFEPGFVPAYAAVLRQTLPPWADRLRERGFAVEIETHDDRGEKDVPQWLRITGWSAAIPTGGPAASRVRRLFEFEATVVESDYGNCTCHSCEKWHRATDEQEPTR